MTGPFPTGRFVWHECLTTEKEKAKAFYLAVTGWTAEVWGGGGEPYTMWVNGDRPLGGLMELPDEAVAAGAPPQWLGYVASPDVEATAQKAQSLGAKVLAGIMEIPQVGRMVVLSDPQGATFAAYTPERDAPGRDGPPGNGDISWNELATSDLDAGFLFYQALFGWERKDSMDMGEAGTYQMFGRPGEAFPLGGIYRKPPEMPGPPTWLYYVSVPEIEAAIDRVNIRGGRVLNGPMEVPGGDRVAQCVDPQGAVFALHMMAG